MSPDEDEGGFLGRWSRLKRTQARTVTTEEPPEPAPLPEAEPEPPANPPALSEEELAELPRIEDLVEGSDIRPFLRAGVPRPLRNAALRRMWMLTPAIRDHNDPAVDYAWDWNTPGGVPGDGVGPSPERAAQMLRDLVTPRETVVAEKAKDETPEEESPEEGEAVVSTAGDTENVMDETTHESPEPDGDESASETLADLPRRRHGSALPG